jgi:outer membrane protein
VNLNWSVWDGGRVKADVAQATAGRRVLEAELRDFDKGLASEIVQCRLGLESALAVVTSAEDGVRSAAEARRVTSDRYAAGVATNLDVLGAQVALLQAELDRTRALANAQMAAARLNRALGL